MKKTLLVLLSLVILLTSFSAFSVHAETYSGTCGDNLTWTFSSATGKLTISGTGMMDDYSYFGDTPWKSYREEITSVTINSGVTSIGECAFECCRDLSSVSIPSSIKSIGYNAFSMCKLTEIDLPEGLVSIGDYAFEQNDIESVTIPSTVMYMDGIPFSFCHYLREVVVDERNPKYYSENNCCINRETQTLIFGGETRIIPEGIVRIGAGAFPYRNDGVRSLVIPDGVKEIERHAFYPGFWDLQSIEIPDSIEKVDCALFNSGSLEDPSIITTEYGNGLYIGNSANPYLVLLNAVNRDEIKEIDIHPSTKVIADDACRLCPNLKAVHIPDGVRFVGEGAFDLCDSLTSVTMPSSVERVGYCFQECPNLKRNEYGNGLYLGNAGNPYQVLMWSTSGDVDSVMIHEKTTVICPDTSYTYQGELTKASVDRNNKVFFSQNDCVIEKSTGTLVIGGSNGNIPFGVKIIGPHAFYNRFYLKNVIIPDGVTTIEAWAFADCRWLRTVSIPVSVKSIVWSAFDDCENIETVYYSGSESDWEKLKFANYNYNNSLSGAEIIFNSSGIPQTDEPTVDPNPSDNPTDNPSAPTDNPSTPPKPDTICSLAELTELDYLAFADFSYVNPDVGQSVEEYFGKKWNKKWSDTDYKNSEIYAHIADWKVWAFKSDDSTGFAAVALVNGCGEAIISYRGSKSLMSKVNSDWLGDWIENDVKMIIDGKGSQIEQALDFYDNIYTVIYFDIKGRLPNGDANYSGKDAGFEKEITDRIHITGHSLGGGLGDIVSAYSGSYAETFNAAPFLDVAYNYFPKLMDISFTGYEKMNYVDHVNAKDKTVGMEEYQRKNVLMHNTQGYLSGKSKYHALRSFISEKSGTSSPNLTESQFFPGNNNRWDMYHIGLSTNKYIYLGYGENDLVELNKNFLSLSEYDFYGGDGNDFFWGSMVGDIFVGGRGDDMLWGDSGNDYYYYRKGDGHDTIIDTSGADRIYLSGFDSDDVIDFVPDQYEDYIDIRCNNEIILLISCDRGTKLNSFKVYLDGEKLFDLDTMFKGKETYKRYVVACPVTVDIVDVNKNSVFTVPNEDGIYSGDFGIVYVVTVNDETTRDIHLCAPYDITISGDAEGTMNLFYCPDTNTEDQVIMCALDVSVNPEMKVFIEESDGTYELKNMSDAEKICDLYSAVALISLETNVSDIPLPYERILAILGENVIVSANLSENYEFEGWYDGDDLVSTDISYQFIADNSVTLCAHYSKVNERAMSNTGIIIGIIIAAIFVSGGTIIAFILVKMKKENIVK